MAAKSILESKSDSFIVKLLEKYPQYFKEVLAQKDELNVKVIYTQIDRDKKGNPSFTNHYFNLRPGTYFYPASTVKLPVAILALQRLRELNIPGLDKNTAMITGTEGDVQTGVCNDPSAADGRPSIAQYIKKILLVSDNDAYNRLYEFLGQEYINNSLHKMGYSETQIIHRLEISLSEKENRHTNPVEFIDSTGKVVYQKPAAQSQLVYADRDTKLGKGYMNDGQLVAEPFDFSKKNRLLLEDLHSIVRSIIFPDAVPKEKRFNLSPDDYLFLRKYMSMRPSESVSPFYDPAVYNDNYVKFIFYGAEEGTAPDNIRSFNKPGDAYGFLTDATYIADFKNKIEFFVSATIYCNSDGILNDNTYDYEGTGLPFLKNLGRVIYEYEKGRPKNYTPDLTSFQFDYHK